MRNSTFQSVAYFLIFFLVAAVAPMRSFAQQTRQASTVEGHDYGCVALVVCGAIDNGAQAVDASITTAASISPPLALGTAALRVGFATPVPAGARVSTVVSFTSGSALSLGLVNNTTISTFTANGTNAKQTVSMGSLLNLTTLSANIMNVEFTATSPFQELEVRTGSVLAVNIGYSVQLYNVSATMTPLPVELTSFTGKARADAVELNWETASERNSAYFEVERSGGAQEAFKAIGKVAATGSSKPSAYQFADNNPLAINYYRLRQVDQDGTVAYSPVVAVKATPSLVVAAYPNPTTGVLTVQAPETTRFTLTNRLGQVVQQGAIGPNEAQELDLKAQPDGIYFLREQTTGATIKVLKAAGSLLN